MIIIDVKKEKSLEIALRILKQKTQKTGLIQELKERKEYKKPSVLKRENVLKAFYTEKIKNGLN
jgi:small subunit ribosomal protein S21